MKKPAYAALFFVLIVGSFLGGAWYGQPGSGKGENTEGGRKILYYVDPMNPTHTSDKPGAAPCGMPMEPVYADDEAGEGGSASRVMSPGMVRITPEKQQTIGVRVEKVGLTSTERSLRTLGRVAADENRTFKLIAGAEGWVWSVQDGTTGSVVQKDQLMAKVYNVDFLAREQQYFYALDFVERAKASRDRAEAPIVPGQRRDTGPASAMDGIQMVPTVASGLNPVGNVYYIHNQVELAKLDLYNLGAGDYQLEELARNKAVTLSLEVRSPTDGIVLARNISTMQKFSRGDELFRVADLTRVWILADVFESDAGAIRSGMTARVSLPRQGKVFDAVVTEVPPQFDQASRTLKARLEVDNPDLALRPDMFVDVDFRIPYPESITVPADAVLDTGLKTTVFTDLGQGRFEPRQVKTGRRFDDRIEILEGLSPGEAIVVSGNFLIDSESRMKLAAAGFHAPPVSDPVCGLEIDPHKAEAAGLTTEYEGATVHFCSRECKDHFDSMHRLSQQGRSLKGGIQSSGARAGGSEGNAKQGWVECPVCGMVIVEEKARAAGLAVEHAGRTYTFCTRQCKNDFVKNPERYMNKPSQNGGSQAAPQKGGQKND